MNEANVNNSVEITPEKEINSALAQKNLADEAIAVMKEKYGSLVLENLDDAVTLKRIHDARMEVRDARIGVEKFCKQARDKSNAYSKAVIAEEKRIVGLISPLEAHLQAEEEKPEQEKNRLRMEQEENDRKRIEKRQWLLIENGMKFDMTNFILNETSISKVEVVNISDTQFDEFLSTVKAENEKQIEVRRKDAADALALAQENARVKKEQDDIAQQQKEEREKIDRDLAEIKKQQRNVRLNLLSSIGMSSQLNGYEYKSIRITWEEIDALDASQFAHEIESLKGRIAALKVSEKAAEEKRIADLAEQKAKDELLKKENEEKERLRIAALAPDKDKLALWAIELRDFKQPGELQSSEANEICTKANEMINDVCLYITKEISNLN